MTPHTKRFRKFFRGALLTADPKGMMVNELVAGIEEKATV